MKFSIEATAPEDRNDFLNLISKLEEDAKIYTDRMRRMTFVFFYLMVAGSLGMISILSNVREEGRIQIFHAAYSLTSAVCAYHAAKFLSAMVDEKHWSPRLQKFLDEIKAHRTETAKFISGGPKPEGII